MHDHTNPDHRPDNEATKAKAAIAKAKSLEALNIGNNVVPPKELTLEEMVSVLSMMESEAMVQHISNLYWTSLQDARLALIDTKAGSELRRGMLVGKLDAYNLLIMAPASDLGE